ncbi:hypothetical protein ES703_113491 [subsurface metagenome]
MTRAVEIDALREANIGIWQTHDGQIMAERQKGKPLEQVGSELGGVTRERVRQVLKKHYGTTEIRLLTETEVAGQLGVSRFLVARIRKGGIVKPQHFGVRYFYSQQDVEAVKKYIQEHALCPMCGGHKSISSRACSSCWHRHRWLLTDEEGRNKIRELHKSWQQRNPDRYKEIQSSARRKHRNKKRGGNLCPEPSR